jgi:hypothetical protein
MSMTKPWAKPFDVLIGALLGEWGGKRIETGSEAANDLFFYPEYEGTRRGFDLCIRISEFPGGSPGSMEADDNVEYLRVQIPLLATIPLRISHEGLTDRIKKALRLAEEYETGNPDFDRSYLLRAESQKARDLLSNPEYQALISALEPFALLIVGERSLTVSVRIDEAAQLEPNRVLGWIRGVLDVAEFIGKHV